MPPIIISESKFKELQQDMALLENTLRKEQKANLGIVAGSFKEAAADDAALKAKESKVNEIKSILQSAKILEDNEVDAETGIGKIVELELPDGTKRKIKFVHPIEADTSKNLISIESEIAKKYLSK